MRILRYIPFVIIGILTFVLLFRNVARNNFSEKESFFWTVAGLVLIFSPLYMRYVDILSTKLGVAYAPSLVFALVFIFMFFLLLD